MFSIVSFLLPLVRQSDWSQLSAYVSNRKDS